MSSLLELIVFIDGHSWLREPIDFGGVLVTGLLALSPLYGKRDGRKARWWQRSWLFLACLGLTLFSWYWPTIFYSKYLNIDEATLVAQAITYETHPIPWRDVDPMTSGPLNGYALLWSVPLGFAPSYAGARILQLFCLVGMMSFLYLAGRRIAGEMLARISILPVFIFLSFAVLLDYFTYTSEQVSLFLIGWALYLLTRLRISSSFLTIIGLGLLIGVMPFAKLQSLLPATALTLMAIWLIVRRRNGTRTVALKRCGTLILAVILPGTVLLSVVAFNGALRDFWVSYIEMARTYGDHYTTFWDDIGNKFVVINKALNPRWDMSMPIYLMLGLAGSVGACLVAGKLKLSRSSRDWYLLGLFLVLAMFATIVATNLFFIHYCFYLLPALVLMTAASLQIFRTQMRKSEGRNLPAMFHYAAISGAMLLVFLGLFVAFHSLEVLKEDVPVLPFLLTSIPLIVLIGAFMLGATIRLGSNGIFRQRVAVMACFPAFFVAPALTVAWLPHPGQGNVGDYLAHPSSPMDLAILHFRPPGGRLAIWGWAPEFAAETGTPLGTRDSTTERQLVDSPFKSYYRQRYLEDMEANRPELFLEGIGPNSFRYHDRQLEGTASFPELAQLIDQNYKLAAEVDGIRLFIRNDLAIQQRLPKTQK